MEPLSHTSGKGEPMSRKEHSTVERPSISYDQAGRSWFLYQGVAYHVARCEQAIFDAFLLECTATWTETARDSRLFFDVPLDNRLLYRWYNLELLCKKKVAVLYDAAPDGQ